MTNMATMPIYAKNLKKSSSQKPIKWWPEKTWYVALSMRVLPWLLKLWAWIYLDLFFIKVKFGCIGFCMGESDFFFHSAKWVNEVEWVSKVKVILWPWPKVIQISKLSVWLWPVYSGERFRASWPSCFISSAEPKAQSLLIVYRQASIVICCHHPYTFNIFY